MNKCPTAVNGPVHSVCVSGSDAGQMSQTGPSANNVSLRAKNKDRQGPHHLQEPRQRPLSTISVPDAIPHSHQRRWSADFCTCGNATGIIVRKKKKQPKPPKRCLALIQPHTDSQASVKRYSCPPLGTLTTPGQSSFSSSSSSATSSCSSPPPTQTSAVAGHEQLHPKSSSTPSPLRANRLSLQIPIPVAPVPNTPTNPDPSTKPALRPKPFHRHHSDSSAFLRFSGRPQSGVTAEVLCAVRLRHVTLSDDDVFAKGAQEKDKVCLRHVTLSNDNIFAKGAEEKDKVRLGHVTLSNDDVFAKGAQEKDKVRLGHVTLSNDDVFAKGAQEKDKVRLGHVTLPDDNVFATGAEEKDKVRLRHVTLPNDDVFAKGAQEKDKVRLGHVTLPDDDVFAKGAQEKDKVTTRPRKIPPPVPEKTALARQIAQLISRSRQRCGPVAAKSEENENLHAGMMKPNPEYSLQTVENSCICACVKNSWATASYQLR